MPLPPADRESVSGSLLALPWLSRALLSRGLSEK